MNPVIRFSLFAMESDLLCCNFILFIYIFLYSLINTGLIVQYANFYFALIICFTKLFYYMILITGLPERFHVKDRLAMYCEHSFTIYVIKFVLKIA